jgi:hypothetical protein
MGGAILERFRVSLMNINEQKEQQAPSAGDLGPELAGGNLKSIFRRIVFTNGYKYKKYRPSAVKNSE